MSQIATKVLFCVFGFLQMGNKETKAKPVSDVYPPGLFCYVLFLLFVILWKFFALE